MLGFVLVLLLAPADPLAELLTRAEVVGHVHDLLRCGGYGRTPNECAAFLVADGGRVAWVEWPKAAGFQRAQWSAPLPAGAVAIVHTHPRGEPYPSSNDSNEAQRLGMPIVAITPATLAVARPDGKRLMIIERFGWAEVGTGSAK
jgi:Prokaryotic homologs of the JAB domain